MQKRQHFVKKKSFHQNLIIIVFKVKNQNELCYGASYTSSTCPKSFICLLYKQSEIRCNGRPQVDGLCTVNKLLETTTQRPGD